MSTTSPWEPQPGQSAAGSAGPAPKYQPGPPLDGPPPGGPPPQRGGRGRGLLVGGLIVAFVVAIAGSASVTYALTRIRDSSQDASSTNPPRYSAEEQAAAKERVCKTFDVAASGQRGQGGVVQAGEVNITLILRKVNSVSAVQNTLTPATPPDVQAAAKRFISTSLDLTTAALGDVPVDELVRLTEEGNSAIYSFADVCGLPR